MSNIFLRNIDKNYLATASAICSPKDGEGIYTVAKDDNRNFSDCVTLDKADLGKRYVIVSCKLPKNLQTRFAELGFVAGAIVTVIKKAPLCDPLEVNVMGYSLCARANELKHITVAGLDDE